MKAYEIKEMPPHEVMARLEKKEDIVILDVREQDEWEAGHIPGARHIPLQQIPARMRELDPKKETIVVCRSGNRSGMACEYLGQLGYNVINMPGGMSQWLGKVEYGQ